MNVMIALTTLLMAAQTPPPVVPPADRIYAWESFANLAAVPDVPPPIQKWEIERYKAILDLSQEQSKFLDDLHSRYEENCRGIDKKEGATVAAASHALASQNDGFSLSALSAPLAFFDAESDFIDALEKCDHRLFADLAAALAEVQHPALKRCELHRQRARCLTLYNIKIKKSRIDLSRLVENARWPANVIGDLEPVMWEYEQQVTPIMERLDRMSRASKIQRANLDIRCRFDDQGQPRDLSNPQILAANRQMVADWSIAFFRESVRLQKQLARMNDDFLPKFMARMRAENAAEFKASYLATAYRRTYPDRADPEKLVQQILKNDEIDEPLRQILASMWQDYRATYESICNAMCKETDRWHEQLAATNSPSGFEENNETMSRLMEERMKKSEQFVRQISDALPPSVLQNCQSSIDAWKRMLDQTREREGRRPNVPDVS